jgi:2'-5' RNA ligase
MRAFVAVPAPPELCRQLLAGASPTAGVRWLPPENLHLTVVFLGDVAEDAVPALTQGIAAACREHQPFELRLERVGPAPPRRPRMIWGWFAAEPRLTALAEAVAQACSEGAPHARPPRTGHPHVTVARLGRGHRPSALGDAPAQGELPVCDCRLMSSALSPKGATYAELARLPLGE